MNSLDSKSKVKANKIYMSIEKKHNEKLKPGSKKTIDEDNLNGFLSNSHSEKVLR